MEHLAPISLISFIWSISLLSAVIMTDIEDGEVDLVAQRKSRTAQQKAVNRLIRNLELMKTKETYITLSLQQLQERETELETILRRGARCNDILLEEELDEKLQEEDEKALIAFQAATAQATKMCQELVVTKTVSCLSDEVECSLKDVEGKMAADPMGDYSEYFPEINRLIEEMNENLRASTLLADHSRRKAAKDFKSKLGALRAKRADVPRDTKDFIKPGECDSTFKLPKINVPKFKGGLENWQSYWGIFLTAVHNNEKLDAASNMAHLMETITDPALTEYLVASNDGKGHYPEVIAYLQQQFDRPRELHSIYCQKLADLQPVLHKQQTQCLLL